MLKPSSERLTKTENGVNSVCTLHSHTVQTNRHSLTHSLSFFDRCVLGAGGRFVSRCSDSLCVCAFGLYFCARNCLDKHNTAVCFKMKKKRKKNSNQNCTLSKKCDTSGNHVPQFHATFIALALPLWCVFVFFVFCILCVGSSVLLVQNLHTLNFY